VALVQQALIDRIALQFGLAGAHVVATLMEPGLKELAISYINTADNVADAFTKSLSPKPFERLRSFMGLL
jgi:hypothetical protein